MYEENIRESFEFDTFILTYINGHVQYLKTSILDLMLYFNLLETVHKLISTWF